MLTNKMKRIIQENTIGLVATVSPEGFPAVSPKATTIILDDCNLAFCNIRSPNTVRNIRCNPAVELNYIDIFRRQTCRISGLAKYIDKYEKKFGELIEHFNSWSNLHPRIRGIVAVKISNAQHIFSPAYDEGANEEALKIEWLQRYNRLLR